MFKVLLVVVLLAISALAKKDCETQRSSSNASTDAQAVDEKTLVDAVKTTKTKVDAAIEKTKKEQKSSKKSTAHEQLKNNKRLPEKAIPLAAAAEIFEQALELLSKKKKKDGFRNSSSDEDPDPQDTLPPSQLLKLASLAGCRDERTLSENCNINPSFHQQFRTINGECNNLNNPLWGTALSPLKRLLPSARYENGFNLPIGWTTGKLLNNQTIPSPRDLSVNLLSSKTTPLDGESSAMVMQWGQFLDHDLDLSPGSVTDTRYSDNKFCNETCENDSPCFPIPTSLDDPRIRSAPRCIGFVRSSAICSEETTTNLCKNQKVQRQQLNSLTAFIDASNVYGSSDDEAKSLRDLSDDQGLLKAGEKSAYNSKKDLLPLDPKNPAVCQPSPRTGLSHCFHAGDGRVNEQLGLTAMHTIWFREHNRIAAVLKRLNPAWDGEKTYQQTRKIVGAMMQHITYKHWLPTVLGDSGMEKIGAYGGYDASVDPSIANEFSTAALRFGHTLIKPILSRLNASLDPIEEGNVMLHRAFFTPYRVVEEGGIDPILRGLFALPSKVHRSEEIITDEVTEHLFEILHQVALDLAALNIQRGRDHGLGAYNSYRKICGLRVARSFDDLVREITSRVVRSKLQKLYGHPNNIDLFVGGILEDVSGGAKVGETFSCILANQFKRLRDGDRFWYEKKGVFTTKQLVEIRKSTLSRVICDNSDGITEVQKDAFKVIKKKKDLLKCSSNDHPAIDLTAWTS